MKIIIVGGGISGLATYLYLRKLLPEPPSSSPTHTIHLYESHRPRNIIPSTTTPKNDNDNNNHHDQQPGNETSISSLSASTQTVGGGLGVSPNGMRVLRDISPSLHAAVSAQGFPCDKFIFMGENGWTLGVTGAGDEGAGYKADHLDGPEEDDEGARQEVCVSSLRGGLWACLRDHVEEMYGADVLRYEKVVEVGPATTTSDGGNMAVVVFENGREEHADLVIGADGVKSVVRKGLFGEGNYEPVYT